LSAKANYTSASTQTSRDGIGVAIAPVRDSSCLKEKSTPYTQSRGSYLTPTAKISYYHNTNLWHLPVGLFHFTAICFQIREAAPDLPTTELVMTGAMRSKNGVI